MKHWPFVILGIVVAALIALPYVSSNYYVRLATFVCLFAALAQSWNFIGGYAGYPSLATAAFYGLGAYVGAICQNHGVPIVLAWLIASVVVACFTAALGLAVLRLRGHYFAVGSIVSVELLRLSISAWDSLTGGGDGLNVPIVRGDPHTVGQLFLYVMLGVALLTFVVTVVVDRSRLGFGLRCIRQNEDAANAIGINTTLYKVIAFVLSGTFCGTVGAIYASWTSYIDPTDSFDIVLTLKVPVMALLGGAGTLFGPLVGAATFVIMEEAIWSNFLEYNRAILGVVIVLLIFFLPGGLLNVRLPRRTGRQKPADRTAP